MTDLNSSNSPQEPAENECRAVAAVVHTTNLVPPASDDHDVRPSPTAQAYGEFQAAFDFFNLRLFSGSLPRCLITLPHHGPAVGGYFSPTRFVSNKIAGATTDEIALNPIHFKGWDATEVLQTLVHEMCHLWQWHFGNPSRSGYHNLQWASKMEAIGLQPVSFDKPGKTTGQRIGDYVKSGGLFDVAAQELLENRFCISWYDRLAEYLDRMQRPDPDGEGGTSTTFAPTQRPGRRQKYSCPNAHVNAWAKPTAKLLCGTCGTALQPKS